MTEPIPLRPRPFRRDGLGYLFEAPEHAVRLRVDYLHRRSDELTGEIVVEATLPGLPSHLHQARCNLTSTSARQTLARYLDGLSGDGRVPWVSLLETFFTSVLRAERQGEPFVRVGRLPARERPPDTVQRLLPAGKPTLLYGPGGTGKGWLAVACCVAVSAGVDLAGLRVQPGSALYLDWEDSAETLDERVKAIAAGLGLEEPPEIGYRSCRGALRASIHQIVRYVTDHQPSLVVVDSVGLAAGLPGERGTYEETAIALFDALRHIPATVLLIDHVSEEGRQNRKSTNKAYGSIYKMNLVRMAWEARKDQPMGAAVSRLGLYNTKSNHGPHLKPLGFRLDFSAAGTVRISRDEVCDSEELSRPLPLHERIAAVLRREQPLSTYQIAERIDEEDNKVRAILSRYASRFVRIPDGRWALGNASADDQEAS